MNVLGKEYYNLFNPALGAVLEWRFVTSYEKGSNIGAGTPYPLLYIVLPMIFNYEISSLIKSTLKHSGVRMFANKFSENAKPQNDLILSIQTNAIAMKKLTQESLKLAVVSNLLTIDTQSGLIISLSNSTNSFSFSKEVEAMIKQADKLGVWFSQVSTQEISSILKVEF